MGIMEKNYKKILDEYVPGKPSAFWYIVYRIVLFFAGIRKNIKFTYNFDKNKMKHKQVLLLCDHSSIDSYMYLTQGYKYCNPNIMVGYQNVFSKNLFNIFLKLGVIPKKLYSNDSTAVRYALNLVKQGRSIAVLPEGIQSSAGYTMPIYPGTASFIKLVGLDCILCKTHGAYLSRPRFDKNYRYGKIEVSYDILFTKEELKDLSKEEIYSRLLEKFKYNDFVWNEGKRYKYKGKYPNAHNIERLLYHCPKCNCDFTLSSINDKLVCKCGFEAYINEYYDISSPWKDFPYKRIDNWFNDERKIVHTEIEKDDFHFDYDCKYYTISYDKLSDDSIKELGSGHICIDKNNITYTGTENGCKIVKTFDINKIVSAPFVTGLANEIYYGNDYYRFVPTCKESISLKVMFIIEELHNLSDPVWKKLLDDTI